MGKLVGLMEIIPHSRMLWILLGAHIGRYGPISFQVLKGLKVRLLLTIIFREHYMLGG